MTEHELPDDMSSWPRDPRRLLGVDQNANERDLKRAYTRLIRRFKPDHHPQQFARIRAAYEELQRVLEWRRQFDDAPDDQNLLDQLAESTLHEDSPGEREDVDHHSAKSPSRANQDLEAMADAPASPKQRSSVDEFESAWQAACEGDGSSGYRRLVALHQMDRGHGDLCLRLYWLLRLSPQLDASRDPADWLVHALQQQPFNGQAWTLYRAEIKRRPELVASPGSKLLVGIGTSLNELFAYLVVRWRAAADLEQWQHIDSDLRELRPLVINEATTLWARMLFLTSDLSVWSPAPAAQGILHYCKRELEQLTELHLELGHDYSRHDLLLELAGSFNRRQTVPVPPQLAAMLRETWLDSAYEARPTIQALLETWVSNPFATLKQMDDLRARHPLVFHQLLSVVDGLDLGDRTDDDRRNEVQSLIVDFFREFADHDYTGLRGELLRLCIEQRITHSAALAAFANWTLSERMALIPHTLAEDAPFKAVLHGIAAFGN